MRTDPNTATTTSATTGTLKSTVINGRDATPRFPEPDIIPAQPEYDSGSHESCREPSIEKRTQAAWKPLGRIAQRAETSITQRSTKRPPLARPGPMLHREHRLPLAHAAQQDCRMPAAAHSARTKPGSLVTELGSTSRNASTTRRTVLSGPRELKMRVSPPQAPGYRTCKPCAIDRGIKRYRSTRGMSRAPPVRTGNDRNSPTAHRAPERCD